MSRCVVNLDAQMAYVLVWLRPRETDKHIQIFSDRLEAEQAARARRREGCEAHVVGTDLADSGDDGPGDGTVEAPGFRH